VNRVVARILHAGPAPTSGPLERWLADARAANGERLRRGFARASADDVRVVTGTPDGMPFGARLRALVRDLDPRDGLIVVGSGAIPLARAVDFDAFAATARSGDRRALANNRYSADIVAVGRAEVLAAVPDVTGDNALPRWLEEVSGIPVADLRHRGRLAMDLDSPLDLVLVGPARGKAGVAGRPPEIDLEPVTSRLGSLRRTAGDRRAELLVAGRTSSAVVRWLERSTACRVRVLIEERGLRASAPEARGGNGAAPREREPRGDQRPPRSALGLILDERGAGSLGEVAAELGDGALIDTRVLLAHRFGADERGWPPAEDRFASDLLLADRIRDPWLRALTSSARDASIPIVLGGHSLVGPGIRFALGGRS
jgi:hypothetical protein